MRCCKNLGVTEFDSALDQGNRLFLFSWLMPWEEMEETYSPQFHNTTGAPCQACTAESAYMQFFLGFAYHSSTTPFDSSRMAHCHKRFSEEDSLARRFSGVP
jgi:hypothetical protein